MRRTISYRLTFAASFLIEAVARARGRRTPPIITRYATWLMGRDLTYSTAKAESRLGWKPALGNRESIERSVRWFLDDERSRGVAGSDRPWQPSIASGPSGPSRPG